MVDNGYLQLPLQLTLIVVPAVLPAVEVGQ